jgi:hypothetical protein
MLFQFVELALECSRDALLSEDVDHLSPEISEQGCRVRIFVRFSSIASMVMVIWRVAPACRAGAIPHRMCVIKPNETLSIWRVERQAISDTSWPPHIGRYTCRSYFYPIALSHFQNTAVEFDEQAQVGFLSISE